jgi:SAM-dependent methyltransferase
VATRLSNQDVAGKRVLEIGSLDINGSARKCVEFWQPAEYVGVDIKEGPGVDLVCDAEKLIDIFSEESFDVVFSTELLEHVLNPKTVISNMKRLCKRNGTILLTTRSYGFVFHPFPYDFWRFELSDMQSIFSDCEIIDLEKDFSEPGVFVKVELVSKLFILSRIHSLCEESHAVHRAHGRAVALSPPLSPPATTGGEEAGRRQAGHQCRPLRPHHRVSLA